jgi:protein-histidine N-methyltransferase
VTTARSVIKHVRRVHCLRTLSQIYQLPSKIAWGVVEIESPRGKRLLLPRRELFDIRMQLMSEEDVLGPSLNPSGLDDADIKTNVYEGGFKTWECSYDLAKLLLDRGLRKHMDDTSGVNHVIEVVLHSLRWDSGRLRG